MAVKCWPSGQTRSQQKHTLSGPRRPRSPDRDHDPEMEDMDPGPDPDPDRDRDPVPACVALCELTIITQLCTYIIKVVKCTKTHRNRSLRTQHTRRRHKNTGIRKSQPNPCKYILWFYLKPMLLQRGYTLPNCLKSICKMYFSPTFWFQLKKFFYIPPQPSSVYATDSLILSLTYIIAERL